MFPDVLQTRLARPIPTFAAALLMAALAVACLNIAWNPTPANYGEYVPIAALLGAFLWERLSSRPETARSMLCDACVIALAAMRVFIPPLSLVSGHALFAMYAALTAQRWPLQTIALAVLAEVLYLKVFASRGWASMLAGFAVAGIAAAFRHSLEKKEPARRIARSAA